MLTLMFITNCPATAAMAAKAGVDRIFIDLEQLGKESRQQGFNSLISKHSPKDISSVRAAVPGTELLVRTNPFHEGLKPEIDEIISRGADVLMLPMFSHPSQVARFIDYVNGRARINLLLETPQAMVRLPTILSLKNEIHEIHVGLNDLHIGAGLKFMFECVAGGIVDFIAGQVLASGLRFGFGGIGRIGTSTIPAEMVLSEHVRMGSSMVILSRAFHQGFKGSLADEIKKLRVEEQRLRKLPKNVLQTNREDFNQLVWEVAGCSEPPCVGMANVQ